MSSTTRTTLGDFVAAAESFAAIRGLALTIEDGASVEERAAAVVALATEGGVVQERLDAEVSAHEAWLASRREAQESRANLAVAIVLLSEQGITAKAIAERFTLKGGNSIVPVWATFGRWVLASVAAGGKRAVASGDADTRAAALSEGWNAVLAAKKAGALKVVTFGDKVASGAAPSALRAEAETIKAKKDAAKAPKEPATVEPQTTGTNTGATEPPAPVEPVTDDAVVETTPKGSDAPSAGDDLVSVLRTVRQGIRQAAAILANDPEGRLTPEQIVAAWEYAVEAGNDLPEVVAMLAEAHEANIAAA